MDAPFLLDLSHTSHTGARTGIQRVARCLHAALGSRGDAITFDPYLRRWRRLQAWERANLTADRVLQKRSARWPLLAKARGCVQRRLGSLEPLPSAAGAIVPEIFSPAVAAQLDALPRPRVALFHDAIPLRLPEFTPANTVARFPSYLRELLEFEGIAAVSDDSREALLDYWRWLGVNRTPAVVTLPLGVDVRRSVGRLSPAPTGELPIVLCVGSVEGRKNHLSLLQACEHLWSRGSRFTLHLVGLPRPETAAPALALLQELQQRGRPVRLDRNADDAAVDAAYAACRFTVYPSLMEGFGLPVLESLAHGKPCICGSGGALGEAARGGGCRTVAEVSAASLASAITELLENEGELERLSDEARQRTFRTWAEYATELTQWVKELNGGRV